MQTKYILPTTNYNRQIYLKGKGCNLHFAKPNSYIQIYLKVRAPSYILCNPLQLGNTFGINAYKMCRIAKTLERKNNNFHDTVFK